MLSNNFTWKFKVGKKGFNKGIVLIIAVLIIPLLFGACDASNDVRNAPPAVEQKSPGPTPGSCNKAADPSLYPLERSIELSNQIFVGRAVKLDPYVWNTSDGKAPADICDASFDPFIPVHIQVLESLKGNLAKNSEVILLIINENNSKPPLYLPTISVNPGDENVWFVGESINYRMINPASPLNYPKIIARYKKRS